MRVKIDEKGISGRDEHWWYLVFDEADGNFYIEHEWNYLGWNRADEGSERILLSEAKKKDATQFRAAVEVLKEKLFGS